MPGSSDFKSVEIVTDDSVISKGLASMKNVLAAVIISGLLFPGALVFCQSHNMLKDFLPDLRFIDMSALYLIGFASGIVATVLMLRIRKPEREEGSKE
jgi:ABC-type multidrug transport system permease subunit